MGKDKSIASQLFSVINQSDNLSDNLFILFNNIIYFPIRNGPIDRLMLFDRPITDNHEQCIISI